MRCCVPLASGALLAALASFGCGNGGDSGPTGPSPGAAAVVVSILGERGNQSFEPNPATAARGQTISWRNNDSVTHRIQFNDGALGTQDIPPGQTSAPQAMPTDGANYHCPLHPGMIGSIRPPDGEAPPCDEPGYC